MEAGENPPLTMRIMHSLRGRLMLLMLVSALPVFFMLLYATFWLRERTIAQSEAHIRNQAHVLATQHEEHVAETRRLLAALADMPGLPTGTAPGCGKLLDNVHRQGPAYLASLFVIAPNGRIRCSAKGEPRPIDVADRPYFQRALGGSGFQGGDYIVSRLTDEPAVVFTHTVRRGDAVGVVLAATLDLSWIRRHPQFVELPPGAAYALYDRDGTLLLHHPGREREAGQEMAAAPFWRIMAGLPAAGTFRSRDADGVERLFGYAPLGPAAAPYARLAVSLPVQSAFAEAERLLELGLLGLALAGALGLLAGWVGGWRLVLRPMQPIFETVRRVAAGDLDARTGVPAGDANEIRRLAQEVDRMAAALAADLAERKAAEEHLRATQQMLRLVTDTIPYHVFWKDRDSVFLGCNAAFAQSVGLEKPEAVLGKSVYEVVPREYADKYRRDDAQVMSSGTPRLNYIEPQGRPDGTVRWLETSKVPLRDGEGRVIGVLGLFRDVSERLRLKEEHQRLQAQLQQAQKMEALGQLTGGIAHDFNNILASILGFTKLALKRHVPDRNSTLAEYLREVVTAGERARDLVAKMLTFSRSRVGGEAPALAPQPLVKEALRMLASTIPASIRIDSRFAEGVPDIAIAPVDLHQILMNLVINARDALEGKGRIDVGLACLHFAKATCSACRGEISGGYVTLSVADSGQGIAPEVLPRIFDPFFTTKEVGKGTGMGLAVVHSLVCRSGGHLLVDSRPGQGSVFQVLLPPAAAAAGAALPAPAAATARPEPAKTCGRVLVVDDEVAIRRLLSASLEAGGWSVAAFGEPRRALAFFRQAPDAWDAVITDEGMPDLTGTELTMALHDLRPDLPVILCTGHSEHVDESAALQLGVHRFFHKPVDPDQLLATLNEAFVSVV